jgi:hypothetical protein
LADASSIPISFPDDGFLDHPFFGFVRAARLALLGQEAGPKARTGSIANVDPPFCSPVEPAHLVVPPKQSCPRNVRAEPQGVAAPRAWLSRLKRRNTDPRGQPSASCPLLCLRQIQRDEDVLAHCIGHPLARSFDPQGTFDFYRAVTSGRLCKQRIAADPGRRFL